MATVRRCLGKRAGWSFTGTKVVDILQLRLLACGGGENTQKEISTSKKIESREQCRMIDDVLETPTMLHHYTLPLRLPDSICEIQVFHRLMDYVQGVSNITAIQRDLACSSSHRLTIPFNDRREYSGDGYSRRMKPLPTYQYPVLPERVASRPKVAFNISIG